MQPSAIDSQILEDSYDRNHIADPIQDKRNSKEIVPMITLFLQIGSYHIPDNEKTELHCHDNCHHHTQWSTFSLNHNVRTEEYQ